MIWLTTEELVEAVRRSLLEYVAPAVDDDFAHVQVVAAAHALLEVRERLAGADTLTTDTHSVEALLASWGIDVPETSSMEPRARNAEVRRLVTQALASSDPSTLTKRLREFAEVESELASRELPWACPTAMATLQ